MYKNINSLVCHILEGNRIFRWHHPLWWMVNYSRLMFAESTQCTQSPLSLKFVFSVGKTEADMHCSMKCPGRPPLVSFFWRPPYVTFWYQTSFWCNYWCLTLTLQSGNVIPFPVHHCKLHCMLMALQSKHKTFFIVYLHLSKISFQHFLLHLERIINFVTPYLCYMCSMLDDNLRKSSCLNTSNQNRFCCWACRFPIHAGSVQECYCIPATHKSKRKKKKNLSAQ